MHDLFKSLYLKGMFLYGIRTERDYPLFINKIMGCSTKGRSRRHCILEEFSLCIRTYNSLLTGIFAYVFDGDYFLLSLVNGDLALFSYHIRELSLFV